MPKMTIWQTQNTYPIAVAPQDATLYITLLPSHAFRNFPFFLFAENALLRAEKTIERT